MWDKIAYRLVSMKVFHDMCELKTKEYVWPSGNLPIQTVAFFLAVDILFSFVANLLY